MSAEVTDGLAERAAAHRALGDVHRLAIVDALRHADRTPGELRQATGMAWNLLAFHLRVLEDAGLVRRRASDGDRRRRYVRLDPAALGLLQPGEPPCRPGSRVVFVCTGNSARSPFAAAAWRARTGAPAGSAGLDPAPTVHPLAVEVAADYGIDLRGTAPRGYEAVDEGAGVVVSVCDRAREARLPVADVTLHWSVPDPRDGGRPAFEDAFAELDARVSRLAAQVAR